MASMREYDKSWISYKMRPLWTAKGVPNFIHREKWGVIQLPKYCQITQSSLDQVIFEYIYIKMNNPEDDALRAEIIQDLWKVMD